MMEFMMVEIAGVKTTWIAVGYMPFRARRIRNISIVPREGNL